MNQVVQDHAGRIRGVPVGVEPRAIQQGKGKIFVAEEDLDLGVGYRQCTNPVRLVVGSQWVWGSQSSMVSSMSRAMAWVMSSSLSDSAVNCADAAVTHPKIPYTTTQARKVPNTNPPILFDCLLR